MKTLACVSPLIYHSVLTSMQIRKQKGTSPAHLPLLSIRCQLPDVWGEQLHQQGEMKHSWQEKRAKIEAYPPSGISFVSFTLFILDLVLSSVMREGSERGAYSCPPPHAPQCPSERKRLRVLPEGTPGLSQHQLHICSLVADTRMTLADPRMKTLIKNLSPPVAYSLLPTDCTWAINPLSTK